MCCQIHGREMPCSWCETEVETKGVVVCRFLKGYGKVVMDMDTEKGEIVSIRYCQLGNPADLVGRKLAECPTQW